ncbi:carbamoyltransferase HypF [Cysteiniphilum sp. QT6929]|uniref:carbamoyltransferase HypF n=1 Tax=Cysteiniphilum sp. QT6929 TaxID=2975055 RepID=UPI0024B3939C|nr:carbamoyltransferase HypF [Cysteiniphilum sp. QT6929]WHN66461.1 carbamoyltransferase HypF [Cysteiniphilum sp. QT6929]
MGITAVKITVNGIVQGVGFRPFVYTLAVKSGLFGSVQNTLHGVEVILQTTCQEAENFCTLMRQQLPKLAQIDHIKITEVIMDKAFDYFSILASSEGRSETKIPADSVICDDCLSELFDPSSRYYLYPFTSCTYCGPRFSVTKSLPYDRGTTTFSKFPLCDDCLSVYRNPLDRRYHAQTTVCCACGPKLSHAFSDMVQILKQGDILALKTHSGFKLVVDAKDEVAITHLRQRKKRPSKPFALMVLNQASIEQYVQCNQEESMLLNSSARPIVLLEKKTTTHLPEMLAPDLNELGVMLPSSAVDYLLFYYLLGQPKDRDWLYQANDLLLVVTSANLSGGSIIADNDQAYQLLAPIADMIVSDDRQIAMQSDDSVMRVVLDKSMMIRRARGFVPLTLKLNRELPCVFATGALLKNTFCFINHNEAYLSQYIGDMDSVDSIEYFEKAFRHYQHLFGVSFSALACDLHPDFYTTEFAERLNLPLIRVQHHEAHIAAAVAEYALQGQVLAIVLDGFGLGDDGIARGGELYHCDIEALKFTRISALQSMPYLGGDSVQKEPWRMALSLCVDLGLKVPKHLLANEKAPSFLQLLEKNKENLAYTTSMGRLFDGVASLLDVCHYNSFEAEAAMKLEALVNASRVDKSLIDINNNQLDISQLITRIMGMPKDKGSELFHGTLAYALALWAHEYAVNKGITQVILTGGCFQNKVLLTQVVQYLETFGLEAIVPQKIPVNDGGISLGQAWLAANKLNKEKKHVLSNSCTDYSA